MTLIILDEAKVEINDHVAWYRERDPVAAERLAAMFEKTVLEIARKAQQYSLMEMRRNPGNVPRLAKELPDLYSVPNSRRRYSYPRRRSYRSPPWLLAQPIAAKIVS